MTETPLKRHPGTFFSVSILFDVPDCGSRALTDLQEEDDDDDDDKHGRARNQEKNSRFTFDLAWATTLMRCCLSLVVVLC